MMAVTGTPDALIDNPGRNYPPDWRRGHGLRRQDGRMIGVDIDILDQRTSR